MDIELVGKPDTELGIGEHKWYAHEDKTRESLMHDQGKGEPIVIRHFEFELNPDLKDKPTKEQILTPEYLKHLQILLWADSLRLVQTPSIQITDTKIHIAAACQARTGANFTEEPKYLQEWLK